MLWSLPTIIIEIAQHSERSKFFDYESNLFCWKCEEICFNIFVSYLSFTNILLKSVIIQVVKNLAFMFLKIADWSIFIDFCVFCDLASRLGRLIICHQKQSKICLQEKMGSPNRRYFKIIYIPFILHKQEMG